MSNNNIIYSADTKTFANVKCPDRCRIYGSEVPVSLLQDLSRQEGVKQIYTLEKYYKNLDHNLNLVVARYDAGLITAAEAVAESLLPSWGERILLAADFDTSANAASAMRYLKDNGVYLMEHPAETTVVGGFIPVSLILPLSQQPGVIAIWRIGYEADLTDPYMREWLNRFKPPRPTSAGEEVQGQAVAPLPPTPTLPARAASVHGADAWHGLGIDGAGASGERVKIGVIDVGFNGYSDLAANGEVPPASGDNAVKRRCYNSLGFVSRSLSVCESLYAGINHGTAVAEAVMDIAPAASLYISNPSIPYIGKTYRHNQLQQTVKWMIGEGVDVIVHSRGWPFDGPGDGSATC